MLECRQCNSVIFILTWKLKKISLHHLQQKIKKISAGIRNVLNDKFLLCYLRKGVKVDGCRTFKNFIICLYHLSPVQKLSLFNRQMGIFKVKNCKCFFKTYAKGCILPLPSPVSLEFFPLAQPEFFSQQPLLVLEGGGGGPMLNRLVPNELCRQLQLGQILSLPPPTLSSCRAVVGAHLPSRC